MKNTHSQTIWDIFCFASLIGIWPRFIEPRLLKTTHLEFKLPLLSKSKQLKIVQISDLHFHENIRPDFFQKVAVKIMTERPDLIVITGDFLCLGKMSGAEALRRFLKLLHADHGIYAILGNHDFNVGLNVNEQGNYDAIKNSLQPISNGFSRLFAKGCITGKCTEQAKAAYPNPELLSVLKEASVTLLNNQTVQVNGSINLTGLGELMSDDIDPALAFQDYDPLLPGVILAHNPDSISRIDAYPGDLVLSGHTHGGQVNLPWFWKRFTVMENSKFKSGLYDLKKKKLFISRGLGGVMPFRFNTVPEIVSIRLYPACFKSWDFSKAGAGNLNQAYAGGETAPTQR